MPPKRALVGCTISICGQNPSWDRKTQSNKLSGWLSHLSGRLAIFSEQTTHLVVSKKRWTENPKPTQVQQALAAKDRGRDIKVVTFDWLEDCLNSQSRKREVPYEWETRDAQDAKRKGKVVRSQAKSAPGVMVEMFHESTERFVDPEEKRKLEKQLEKEREVRKAKEQEEREDIIRQRKEKNKLFARGAKKAKDQLMTDTYHIYQDDTGFKYDILVTKVDPRANRNERWNLTVQMFESNTEPHDFAVATQISGTARVSANNVICAIGTRYPTAFHAFKSEFHFHTGTDWDARISAHIKRIREEKIQQGVGTGSSVPRSVHGVPVSESAVAVAVREVPFEQRKFEYHPPGYGPKGEVTKEEKDRLRVIGITVIDGSTGKPRAKAPAVAFDSTLETGTRMAIEEWIMGADTSAIDMVDKVPTPPVDKQSVVPDVDFNLVMAEEDYPFERPTSTAKLQSAPVVESNETQVVQVAENQTGEDADRAVQHVSVVPLHSSPTLDDSGAADPFDYEETLAMDMLGDQEWLNDHLAQMQDAHATQSQSQSQAQAQDQQQPTPPASTPKPSQVQDWPPVEGYSTSSKGSKGLFSGSVFNLGSSILGKRKGAPAGEGEEIGGGEGGKKATIGEDA